ncbi:MAG TPA: phospholipid carrier-dependent glycosyltransferase [Candidatus Paceibacterota bacterium]|nr:phospholipid carrier-dependent glycosyltransferase [Candidatus Paceibacterota bacterium]
MRVKKIFQKEWFLIAIIVLAAIVTRFYHFGQPNQIIFDEVYFPKFATDYFRGDYYFDIHPPLAKLMMAGTAKLLGTDLPTTFDFKNISQTYPDDSYKILRFLVSSFGVMLIIGIYFLTKELFHNKWPAFLAGLLAIFDNALLVQSRVILTDVFLLAFGVLGLVFIFVSRRKRPFSCSWFVFLILAGLFLAAGLSVKWTALLFVGVAGIILLTDWLKNKQFKVFLSQFLVLLVVSSLFYFSIFAIHLKLLPQSGTGDAFMSQRFQRTLIGNPLYGNSEIKPANIFQKFIELNKVMYSANAGLTATHAYGSRWYTWPLLIRPIYYWFGAGDDVSSKIYLQGNPLIWWPGFLAIIYWFFWFWRQAFQKNKDRDFTSIGFILAGYFCNLLPYVFVSRVSFLYHYFPSLIFLFIALGFFLWKYFQKYPYLVAVVLLLIIASFAFFAPLSYGLPLTESVFNERVWLPTWL